MDLRDLLLKPSKFKEEVIRPGIPGRRARCSEKQKHMLKSDLADYVNDYDFESFGYASSTRCSISHRLTAYWTERFRRPAAAPKPG